MGSIIRAVCKSCGYEKELKLGGGKLDFHYYCAFPALNKTMKQIEERNIYQRDRDKKNPSHILFYDDKTLIDKKSIRSKDHLQWGKYTLYDANYYCPKCKKFDVKFHFWGCFD